MAMTILGIISAILTIIIGLWKYNRSKQRTRNEQIEEADKLLTEGIREASISKINRGFDRLSRLDGLRK